MGTGSTSGKKALIIFLKIIGWAAASVLLLMIALAALIQVPSIQNMVTKKAVAFLEGKIHTRVRLDHVSIGFPKQVSLEGLFLEDQSHDTLLFAERLSVNTDLLALTRNEIQLDEVHVKGLHANVHRSRDSVFNFDYIINAFAGKPDSLKVPPADSAAWEFAIDKIYFNNLALSFNDSLEGNFVDLKLATLEADVDEFDLKKAIEVDHVFLSGVNSEIVRTAVPQPAKTIDTTASAPIPPLLVDEIEFENIHLKYNDRGVGQFLQVTLGKFLLEEGDVNISLKRIGLGEFSLEKSFVSLIQTKASSPADTIVADSSQKEMAWQFSLEELSLTENGILLYDSTKTPSKAFDVNHLSVESINLNATNIKIDSTDAALQINEFSFREGKGFSVQSMEGTFRVTDNSADIENFFVETERSNIHLNLQSTYQSLASLLETYPSAQLQGTLQSSIALQDILFFQPTLTDSLPITIPRNSSLVLNTQVKGRINDLEIQDAYLKSLNETSASFNGRIHGLPDIVHARMAIRLKKLYTTKNDLSAVLPDTLLPESIQLPAWASVEGNFSGTITTPSIESTLSSDFGSVYVKAIMNVNNSNSPAYNGRVKLTNFKLGDLLKQPDEIGMLNMEASVKGKGTIPEDMDVLIEATISSFAYKKYTYRNFQLAGSIKKYLFSGKAAFDDPNLNFKLEGDLDYTKDTPQYKLALDLKNIDLKALHLAERPLKARGALTLKLDNATLDDLNGDLAIHDVAIYNGEHLYRVNSFLFASINQEGKTEINLNSDFADGQFKGNVNLASLPEVLKNHFRSYYTLHDSIEHDTTPQNFSFSLQLKSTELLTDVLLPELSAFEPGEIRGEFNSEKRDLDVSVDIRRMKYAALQVEDLVFKLTSDKRSLQYDLTSGQIAFNSVNIPALEVTGNVRQDSINTNLIVMDSLKKEKYILGGSFRSEQAGYRFYFNPEQVMLNYKPWEIPPDNYLQFGKGSFMAHNMVLTKGREKIMVTTGTQKDSSITVSVDQLDLKNLASMVSSKDTLFNGLLQGDVKIMPAKGKGAMEAHLSIRDFAIQQKPWGNVTITVLEKRAGSYAAELSVKGEHNDVKLSGDYTATENNAIIDAHIDIARLDATSIEPLTGGQAKEMTGFLTGDISLKGPVMQPVILGELHFKNVQFLPTYVNTKLLLKNETIKLTKSGISFGDFRVLDSQNNFFLLSGDARTDSYKDFEFDLRLKASNFQLLNTTERNSKLFYGNVRLNTEATIRGTSKLPVVNMKASLGSGSSFTYIMPQPENGVLESAGIVKFVNKKANDPFLKSLEKNPPAASMDTIFHGIDLTANIELTDKETFNIIIDPMSGDKLTVNGNANLSFSIVPTGSMQLSGRYELTKGSYNFNFHKLAKRSFDIRKGSSITWTGDLTDATLDITAVYRVETSPIDLVSNQLAGSTPEEMNQYKQRLPFIVYLMIRDKLLTPAISFQIDMPEQQRNALGGRVYASIQDINTREADRDKQVFALIILKRFISDNPLESQGDTGIESTARRSVSNLLSEQLNRLSSNIKGVELSFDVKSYKDYSTGQGENNTQVQLGLSKSLFDNRLVVKVTGNINVEGDQSQQNTTSDYIGDLALEYKITEDGRFRITGFRRSDYSMIDGELTNTGTGIIYIKDYNTLRELFKANAKEEN